MSEIFAISFRLKIAYRVNTILYRIRQLVPAAHRSTSTALSSPGLKTFATVLAGLWEVVSGFLGKFVYIFLLYEVVTNTASHHQSMVASFLTTYLLLGIAGACLDAWMFTFSRNDYYAIVLMRMNARNRALSGFFYRVVRSVVGGIPFILFFGLKLGLTWWMVPLVVVMPTAVKSIVVMALMLRFERSGRFDASKPLGVLTWPITLAVAAVAVLLIVLGRPVNPVISIALMTVAAMSIMVTWPKLLGFRLYPELCKIGATQAVSLMNSVTEGSYKRARMNKNIEFERADASHTVAGKHGLSYLNALFFARHRRIFWGASLKYSAICAVGSAVAIIVMVLMPGRVPDPVSVLPWLLLVMYAINRGTTMTEAMYIDCDHSLLTYPFYKQSKHILESFRLRLWEISAVNLLPATVLGIGLVITMALFNPNRSPYEFLAAFLSILVIAVFFSVHYLALYYLLQPYIIEAKIKSFTYQIAVGLTYGLCYLIAVNYHHPSLMVFGAVSLGFCILYSLAACIVVYRFAPRTFRIKS